MSTSHKMSVYRGAFSVVRLAVHCETNLQVACKIMPLDIVNCRKGLKQQIAREIRLLKQLAHVSRQWYEISRNRLTS